MYVCLHRFVPLSPALSLSPSLSLSLPSLALTPSPVYIITTTTTGTAPWAAGGSPLLLASVAHNARTASGASSSSVDVQMILEELGSDAAVTEVYSRDAYGRTPVHLAALNGCPDTVYQLMNTYRRNMYQSGVLEHVSRLRKERAACSAELRSALIRSGSYTAVQWDLKVQRMEVCACVCERERVALNLSRTL